MREIDSACDTVRNADDSWVSNRDGVGAFALMDAGWERVGPGRWIRGPHRMRWYPGGPTRIALSSSDVKGRST